MSKLTEKEENMLIAIDNCSSKNEPGFSEFLDDDVKTKSRAGVISSLLKKDFVYDSYKNSDGTNFVVDGKAISMFVITDEGIDALRNKGHVIESFNNN
tara:strand:- start:291 stop:584 length:294 start_codon:yes stop_codon:yes gene_type:complete